ncbi:MAG: ABC transporter substrate-binding protein [Zoogloea sp.]|nr:ABC transporter substrate-binding protein [Zoogloea sp.]
MTSRTRLATRRLILAGLAASVLAPFAAIAADAPKVIRIGLPLVGTGNRPVGGSWNFATVQIKGSLEQEFKADGIRIEWNNFKGAGPALNEAIANKLIDVFAIGDLPGIVGKASGLKTKLIAADNRRYAYAIAVPADSQARSIEDLKGKKLAVFKGTAVQLGFGKFLSRHGLSEKDFKIINMDSNTATAALATKDVDALFTAPSQLFPLEDRGVAKVIYNERHDPAAANDRGQAYVVATEDFEKAHPELVQRIVNVLVREAAWSADEKNRTALLQLWAKSGTPFSAYRRDYEGQSFKEALSPLLDEEFVANIQRNVTESQKLKLVRGSVDAAGWVERKYLDVALKSNGLTGFWTPLDAGGKPKK